MVERRRRERGKWGEKLYQLRKLIRALELSCSDSSEWGVAELSHEICVIVLFVVS